MNSLDEAASTSASDRRDANLGRDVDLVELCAPSETTVLVVENVGVLHHEHHEYRHLLTVALGIISFTLRDLFGRYEH